ncbi:phosphotransferase family protein [Micromonospora sp. NPDC023814]|uniref:phosphotransferase family protein n=1 Tax=Micromonospora sp. NPDC023814 TaxID=3154596 RepID=UPI0033F72C7C
MTAPTTDEATRLGERLRAVLAERTGDPGVRVDNLRRLPAGASRHTWSFDLRGDRTPPQGLILRMDAPGGFEADAMGRETALMAAAGEAGVPSPAILASSTDADDLGAAYVVMARIEGESIPRKILRDEEYAAARPLLAAQCGRILARIHRISPAAVPGLEARDELDTWRRALADYGHPHPAFELAIRWLDTHRPASVPPRVVHGDFRNGNFIVGPEGIRAVLDWELAHLGDPLEDLGWLCVRAWRFGQEPVVGGFGPVDDLVAAYEAESGTTVDREALHWWQVMGTLKWGVICIHQTERHRSGATRSVELATIGRRVSENEWELLQLLP